ncbi:CocE/NonD family hydrolase [Candidatus Gracilibacteria bacterium]|nr:CocE/NonD family hydrolase [Candidatus Gracilibacteria bacterium]NJM89630.1 CocE/NonD family hydrolase [Hydrococcus sp. RU_2_2]NJP21518.1 CocE/NonD family hydrolase [Hydrococcus sp. CRU_1_1]
MFKIIKETASMYTRDRILLDADIYRPNSSEQFPVLLMRQPYGREIASTVVYAHPSWYAAQGYIVVIQDVRGRGTSQGTFELFTNEINDGYDTVNWASQLSGSTGKVGMYGFSYQGMTQLYAAVNRPNALKAICPSMVAYDLYSDWAYENKAFCWQANLGWAIQLAAETARLQEDEVAFQKLYLASRNLPLNDLIPANPNLLKELAPDSFYHDWLNHPYPDEYWEKLSPKNLLQNVDLPMLHIGGWFDPYLRGTLNLYHAMVGQAPFPQYLIIGPWAHLPWGRKLGAIDYGESAISPIDRLQVAWFNKFLKGIDSELLNTPSICLFEMGSNRWRYFDKFPDNNHKYYYLTSNGLANIREDDGKLVETIVNNSFEDILVHDPWRPVPALGGHATIPAGAFDRSSIDCRNDVLTYTSDPLTEDLSIVGEITIIIDCQADAPSFDICAVLSQVYPDGRVYNFTQGYIKIDSDELPIKIPLQATCIKISQENCLRLSLSAACFPAYPVNAGTGKLAHETRLIESKIITIKVINSCSQILLSIQ